MKGYTVDSHDFAKQAAAQGAAAIVAERPIVVVFPFVPVIPIKCNLCVG
ncbi:Mur ligase domain-containing protein [Bacillus sp. D-CC]